MKSEQKSFKKRKNRPFDLSKRTVYCLFHSKKSFDLFRTELIQNNKNSKEQNLFKAEISVINTKRQGTIGTLQTNDIQCYRIGQFSKQFKCINCGRIQSTSQEQNNVCQECNYLQKLVKTGNLQKFVYFLLDFKTQKSQTPQHQRSKIQRIQSIESCQSLIVDKADQNKNNFHHHKMQNSYNQFKDFSKSINSLDIDRHFQKGNDLISSESSNKYGYFCNQCQIVPIVGRRFHCLSCEDFDLCQKCYFHVGHKHQVKSFDDKKLTLAKKVHLETLKKSQKLKNTLNCLSSSIRNFESKTKLYQTATLRQIPQKQKQY